MNRGKLLLSSAATYILSASFASVILLPGALHAQETAKSNDGQLDEIIVTAQRREENLQSVPIAVTAVTGANLANTGITNSNALAASVPSMQLGRSGPSALLFIRGVGNTAAQTGEEGSNAIYVDGVYLADLPQAIQNFAYVERVELLKGPQGTLFGRNSSGGVLNIITKDPGKDFELSAKAGYANFNTYSGQAYVAGPLSNTIGASFTASGSDQKDGWGKNFTTGIDNQLGWNWGVRSKIVWTPSDIVKVTAAGDYSRSRDSFALGWRLEDGYIGANPLNGAATGTSPGGHNSIADFGQYTELKTWGVSLKEEIGLGDFATVTNITAYRDNNVHSLLDVDVTPSAITHQVINGRTKAFQEELRIASKGSGPLSWQGGAFYLSTNASTLPQENYGAVFSGGAGSYQYARLKTQSFALFGEVTYAITPTTHLTGGLRHTWDHRTLQASAALPLGSPFIPLPTPIDPLDYGEFTYRIALKQDLTDHINVYGSFNRGFKAGIWSLTAPTLPPAQPQYTNAYEVGLKSELFDRRLRLNIAAYHYDISNYQVRSSAVTPGVTSLFNAASVKVDGVDVDFEAKPLERVRLYGGFTVLNSRFGYFPRAPYVYPNPATCNAPVGAAAAPAGTVPGQTTGAATGGVRTCYGDATGNKTPFSPNFVASLGMTYALPVSENGELRFSALYNYNSGYSYEPDTLLKQRSYNLVNGSVEFRPNRNWGVELWVRNLTDQVYFLSKQATGSGPFVIEQAPRTFGFNLKYDY